MFSNEEEEQKRELMRGFLGFLVDGAAHKIKASETPSLADAIADRVSQDTQRHIDERLARMIEQALLRSRSLPAVGGDTAAASAFGRFGLFAVGLCGVLAAACILLAILLVMRPAAGAVDPGSDAASLSNQVADDPGDPATVSGITQESITAGHVSHSAASHGTQATLPPIKSH